MARLVRDLEQMFDGEIPEIELEEYVSLRIKDGGVLTAYQYYHCTHSFPSLFAWAGRTTRLVGRLLKDVAEQGG